MVLNFNRTVWTTLWTFNSLLSLNQVFTLLNKLLISFFYPFLRERDVDPSAFPKYWPRTDRSVNIIPPVNSELTKAITERFGKIYRSVSFKMEILSIEELCNFNVYATFIR